MKIIPQKYQMILITAFILGIFYPAVFAEICLVDDTGAISSFLNSDGFSLKDIFIPGSGGGGYYRPFIMLSYILDKWLWYMDSKAMHLDNILMHCFNVLLVYMLASTILDRKSERSAVPLIAALMFGVHPTVTESVNWISGRTDLMAANFVLLSAIFLFRYLQKDSLVGLGMSFLMFLCAVFSKETAFGFLPAAILLVAAKRTADSNEGFDGRSFQLIDIVIFLGFVSTSIVLTLFVGNYWLVIALGATYHFVIVARKHLRSKSTDIVKSSIKQLIAYSVSLVTTIGLFVFMRRLAFTSDFDKMSQTLKLIFADTNHTLSVFLGSVAFYVRKFIQPLPLNFYIREIDPLYSLAGIVLFFTCITLVHKRTKASAFFLSGICMVLPVLPFAFGTIAWTAFAERYIYISSAFWIISICLAADNFHARHVADTAQSGRFALRYYVFILLAVMMLVTFQRNLIWMTNLDILRETVTLSPESKPLRGLYMLALLEKGDTAAAKQQYYIASSLYSLQYDERYETNMAGVFESEGNYIEAEKYYLMAIDKTKGKSIIALQAYFDFLNKDKTTLIVSSETDSLISKQFNIGNQLYELNKDPLVLYRLGQVAISARLNNEAVDYFSRAAKELPLGSPFQKASLRMLSEK